MDGVSTLIEPVVWLAKTTLEVLQTVGQLLGLAASTVLVRVYDYPQPTWYRTPHDSVHPFEVGYGA